jgi:hypothetical protein
MSSNCWVSVLLKGLAVTDRDGSVPAFHGLTIQAHAKNEPLSPLMYECSALFARGPLTPHSPHTFKPDAIYTTLRRLSLENILEKQQRESYACVARLTCGDNSRQTGLTICVPIRKIELKIKGKIMHLNVATFHQMVISLIMVTRSLNKWSEKIFRARKPNLRALKKFLLD